MKTPEYPDNESSRLDTLHALNILDTSHEERFDRLTRLARRVLGVPIALVSLVDTNRQWFKSKQGLEAPETPRDISFCGHAILGDEILVVEDATRDERFHDNPLVTDDPSIRFYAGYPLTVANGSKLGTLCVIDSKPRVMSDEDLELLKDLGRMVEQEISAVQLATMDDLTQLSNRRGFLALSQHAFNVCKRLKVPSSLFFIDLDGFKGINDRYGHAEGDRALTCFSDLLRQSCRESDVVGRLGGDEFAVFLIDADESQSEAHLKRLQSVVSEYNEQNNHAYDLNYSAGLIPCHMDKHSSVVELLEEADALMYAQKAQKETRGRG